MARSKKSISFLLVIVLVYLWATPRKKKVTTEFRNYLDKVNSKNESLLETMDIDCVKPDENYEFFGEAVDEQIDDAENKCEIIQNLFNFQEKSTSKEEEDYPLAYSILAFKDMTQLLFMLSAFYQPQNVFCIAYPENSSPQFQKQMVDIQSCWKNVYFFKRPKIEWGSFEIINSVYFCLDFMTHLNHDWKYYQYLSGVDVPLKTNLEMVKIFKSMKETPNFEVTVYPTERLISKNIIDSPLPLFKSSLSAIIPRKTADSLVSSNISCKLLTFLNGTFIPDETFWATLMGNKNLFNISGSIDGEKFIKYQESTKDYSKYYIARYQEWESSNCYGYFKKGSCVFGVNDLWHIRESKHLVAHKLYIDFQPAAFFCLLKEHRYRTFHPITKFSTSFYSTLPQVKLVN